MPSFILTFSLTFVIALNNSISYSQRDTSIFSVVSKPLDNYHLINLDTLTLNAKSKDVIYFFYFDDNLKQRKEKQIEKISNNFSSFKNINRTFNDVHFYGVPYKSYKNPSQIPKFNKLTLSGLNCIVYTKDPKRLQRAADLDTTIKVDGSKTPENYYDIIILDSNMCLGYDFIPYYDPFIQDFINPNYTKLEKAQMSQSQLEDAVQILENTKDSLTREINNLSEALTNSRKAIDSVSNQRKHQNRFKNRFFHGVNIGMANHSLSYETLQHPLTEKNTISAKSSFFGEYVINYFLHSNLYIGTGMLFSKQRDEFEYKLLDNYTVSDSNFIAVKNDTTGINKSNRARIPLRAGLQQEIHKLIISISAEAGYNYLRQEEHITVDNNELVSLYNASTYWDLILRFNLRYPILEKDGNQIYLSLSYMHQPELQLTNYSGNLNVRSRSNFVGVGLAVCLPNL